VGRKAENLMMVMAMAVAMVMVMLRVNRKSIC